MTGNRSFMMRLSGFIIAALFMMMLGSICDVAAADTLSLYVSVVECGATGDGLTDDSVAIQQAVNVATQSGKDLYFPSGTYIINPTSNSYITLRSNINITGDKGAVIKVKDNAGNYTSIFGADSYVENISISNITIDQNGQNNSCSITPDFKQTVLTLENCKNITVENVVCDSYSGMNAFSFEGENSDDVTIKNCYFRFVRAQSDRDYETSTLYVCGKGFSIVNNRFYADIFGRAQTATEICGREGDISGNITEGFFTGAKLVSRNYDETVKNNISVTGNTFSKANHAIALLCYSGHNISNIIISDNTISVFNTEHEQDYSFGIATISDSELWTGSYDTVSISNNTVKFQKETDIRENLDEIRCCGIGLSTYGTMKNVNVTNNTISNAPLTGIRVGLDGNINTYSNINVKDNLIVNAGNYKYARGLYRRAAIYLIGVLDNVFVEGNSIYDDNEVFSGFQSIVTCGNNFQYVSVKNNSISSKSGGYYFYIPSSIANVDIGAGVNSHYVEAMSVVDKISLNTGDIIYTEEDTNSYRVFESGTIGALSGVSARAGKGNKMILVSDSAGISVGDYITFEADEVYYRVMKITGNEILLDRRCENTFVDVPISFKEPIYKVIY